MPSTSLFRKRKKSGLNVFEETVLKITEIESGNTEKIAEITCMDKELVCFIQNRLNQLGLLNDRYELSENGQELLDEWQNKSDGDLEYTVATVFVDLLSGKLLPYIHTDDLRKEKILSIEDNFITVELGSTGKSVPKKCRLIRPTKNSFWKVVPNSNDIIKAIREFKKKYKRYALLKNEGIEQYPPMIPMAEAITINENPEFVYLHCQALIQTGNSDLLVTDGYGFGFSEGFANYLTSQDWKWVIDMKKKGVVEKIDSSKDSDNQPLRKQFKYAEISKRITRSRLALQKITKLKVNNTNYEKDYRAEIENGIKELYAAVEWSLRQIVAENPVSEWEMIFSTSNFRDNEKLLVGFAQKAGFPLNEKNKNLLQVKPRAIRQIEKGKVELQPLLALAITGANSNTTHPIHRLAQNHSGFLTHIWRLKKYRDPIEHGSTEKLEIDENILEELIEMTIPMIISLIPGVESDLREADNITNLDDINQERLKANISLEKALGTAFVQNLNGDIKEQLVRAEIMTTSFSEDKTIEIIKCYASVMQHSLFDAVKDRILESKNDNLKEGAVERIVQAEFFSAITHVPEQLTTVDSHKINRTIQGSSTTLGAHLLAVFLLGSESELFNLQKSDPTFVEFVADLIRLRGHGNKPISEFTAEEIESVRNGTIKNNVFKAIKLIMEVF